MTYLSANSRAPWFVQRGSNINKELFRLFDNNLRKPAQTIGIKILDKIFARESEEPFELRLHQPGEPFLEMGIFAIVFAYLYLVYVAVGRFFVQNSGSKVKGT